jgi:SAM-dependent methyltransferase
VRVAALPHAPDRRKTAWYNRHLVPDTISCVACSGVDVYVVEQWPAEKGRRALACRDCGLLFIHPTPSRKPLQPSAAATTRPADEQPSRTVVAPSKKGAARALLAALDRHLAARQPSAGARVLDFACGTGAWLNALQDCGWETFGIESSTDIAFTRHRRLTAVPSEPEFDLVILYQILQRVPRPLDTLRELSRAMRPGAHCLVSVPRIDTLAMHGNVRYCLGAGQNIVAFTEACLRGLLARAGLEVVAALHELDAVVHTWRESPRLRLLARKVDRPTPVYDAAAALQPVIEALSTVDTLKPGPPRPAAPTECPACASSRVRVIDEWRLSGSSAHAAGCMECGLLFVHPPPSQEALDAYYAREDGYLAWKADRLPGELTAWAKPDDTSQTPRRTKTGTPVIFTALDRFLPTSRPAEGARVLDFGCGPGTWLDSFQDHGWRTYGLEPCTDAAFVRHTRVTTVPAEPQFQLVFLYHVLEHLPRPLDTLRELARALLPGGFCFVSVPRIDTLAIHGQADYCLHAHHHIVGFTEACLRGLLARAGLEFVASFHDLPSAFSKKRPTRLQLLARKANGPVELARDPAAALSPVIAAFVALKGPRVSAARATA